MDFLLFPITIFKLISNYKNCYFFGYSDVEEGSVQFRERDVLPPLRFGIYISLIIGFASENLAVKTLNSLNPLLISENVIQYFIVYAGVSFLISAIITYINKCKLTGAYFKTIFFSFLYTSSFAAMPMIFIYFIYTFVDFISKRGHYIMDRELVIEILAILFLILQLLYSWMLIKAVLYIFKSLSLKRNLILTLLPLYFILIVGFILLIFLY